MAFPGFPNVADDIGATPAQVGFAWLLAHSQNTLLIPGTRSIGHPEQNVAAGDITLTPDAVARLDPVGSREPWALGLDQLVTD